MQKWGFSTFLAFFALVGVGCIPSTRNSLSIRTPTTASPSIFNSPSNQNLTPSEQVCVHYDANTPFKSYCEACVDEVLSLYCPGEDEPTGCSSSIQSTFNTRVNQCISNTLTLGFACARTCGAGTVLDNTCSCAVPAPPTFNGQGVLPTQDYGLLNVGAPTSVAVLRNNSGTSFTPASCSLNLNLDLTVTNRSLTHPRTNTYEFDFAHISRGFNPQYVTQASQLVLYEDPIRNVHARATLGLGFSRSTTGVDSLGRIERYSGKPFQSDTTGTGASGTLTASSALWSQSMGQIVSTRQLATPKLYVADIANNRIRSIDTATSAVSDVIINTAASIKTVMPYGLAKYESGGATNLFVGQWGFNGGGSSASSLRTGSVVSDCAFDDNGFCENNPTDGANCLELQASGFYVSSGTALPLASADSCTSGFRVQMHQTPVVAGISLLRKSGADDVLYLALPHEGALQVLRPGDRTDTSAEGTWTANSATISLTSGLLLSTLANGSPVTVWGQESCTSVFTGIPYIYDDLPRNLERETLYYVVNKSANVISLSSYPDGPPITFSSSRSFSTACASGNQNSGNITLSQWTYSSPDYSPSPTFNLPSDIKVDSGSSFIYVTDAGTGILWRAPINALGTPTSWTAINTIPTEGTVPSDKAIGTAGNISIRLVNPIGLAISENPTLPDDVLIVEGKNPDPYTQPGGGVVRIYCANDDTANNLTVSAPCKGKAAGIYRLAGSFQGHVSVNRPAEAVTFDGSAETVILTSHNLQNGDRILFNSITTTTGINLNTAYSVINRTPNTFQISTSATGTALDLVGNGTGMLLRSGPDLAPLDATFSSPVSLAIATPTESAGQLQRTTPAFLVSDAADAGIFRLSPQSESGLLGLKYRISDIYNQTAYQCLRFQASTSCSGWGSPRSVSFTAAGDTVTLASHGLRDGDRVVFSSITTTTGIVANVEYYVRNSSTNAFQVSATSSGALSDLINDGSGSMLSASCSCRAIPVSHADVPLWQAVGTNDTCETFQYP